MNECRELENPNDRADLCVELTAVRVAELIAKQLEQRGIERSEFARMLEVTPGRVSQILDPDSNLQLRTVARALAVLGMVMDVSAVPLESFSSPEAWVEDNGGASASACAIASPSSSRKTAKSSAAERNYALAA